MATGCAGDQEPLQGPCPVTPRPITGCWPAHRIDGHRLRRRPGTAAGALPWYSPDRSPAAGPPTGSMATGCAGDQERLQGACPGTLRPITGSWPAPPARWPPAAPVTRSDCRGPALVLPDRSPAAGRHHLLDGHRLHRRPGTAAGALPWYSTTDHQLLAGTTGSMATGCTDDQERLQGPCPGTPRPITSCWPAPPDRWPTAAPMTRNDCRGPALVLSDRSPAAGRHHLLDGHRLRR